MYYPYLRGKQEELLALQELINEGLLSAKLVPVIEPVVLSSTLVKTLKMFIEKKRDVIVVKNPLIGHFDDDMSINTIDASLDDKEKARIAKKIAKQEQFRKLMTSSYMKIALIYKDEIEENYSEMISDSSLKDYTIILSNEGDFVSFCKKYLSELERINYCFVPTIEYKENNEKAVLFRDRFVRRSSNSEYTKPPVDEFFSRDHIIINEYSYQGFSDYSIIGSQYDDSGFAPYAIALHIAYLEKETNIIRIRHFTSNSNLTNKNQALKFSEAVAKLQEWFNEHNEFKTLGLDKILGNYREGNYPGLGSLKRFSIMHHLELIAKYIDKA